jgi:hypothetical protein
MSPDDRWRLRHMTDVAEPLRPASLNCASASPTISSGGGMASRRSTRVSRSARWSPWTNASDFKRVHEDVQVLTELSLVKRGADGGVACPFDEVHIDMRMHADQVHAA